MQQQYEQSYIRMPMGRDIHLIGEVSNASCANINQAIIEINEDDVRIANEVRQHGFVYTAKPINLFIDSPGGDPYSAMGTVSVMLTSNTPVNTIVTGIAMSTGFIISLAGKERYAHKYSRFMLHEISSGTEGTLNIMSSNINEGKRIQSDINEFIIERTKITKAKMQSIYKKNDDWYMSSQEALELGVIDKIIRIPTTHSLFTSSSVNIHTSNGDLIGIKPCQ